MDCRIDPAFRIGSLAPVTYAFILLPRFSLFALAGAVEPLRHANQFLRRDAYCWTMYTEDGKAIRSSSGIEVVPSGSIENVPCDNFVMLVGGADILSVSSANLRGWLRKMAVRAPMIGGLCTASRVLADAGLLDGYRATIHWEMSESFREAFPRVEVTGNLFEIDHNRMTCAGEAASTDLMLTMLAAAHGNDVASTAAAQVLHARVRSPIEPQASLALRTGTRNRHLLKAIAMMESHRDELLSIELIAHEVGCSRRQLERIFKEEAGCSPVRHYRNLRLDRARQLLLETGMSCMEVAVACGFCSSGAFSNAYRRRYGTLPARDGHTGRPSRPGQRRELADSVVSLSG